MLQINYLRENKEEAIERLAIKNFDASGIIDQAIELDNQRRKTQNELDETLAEANNTSKEIGGFFKRGMINEANELKLKTAELKAQSKELNEKLGKIISGIKDLMLQIPNIPHPSVPAGNSDADNETILQEGEIPELMDKALPHWELATKYNIIDFDLGSKVTGAGFPFYIGKGAKLQRALINFFLDRAMDAGYTEIQPPLMVNEDSGYGTGQLPD